MATSAHTMPFGAELMPDGSVRFRLWAPGVRDVQVVLAEGPRLAMATSAPGLFEVTSHAARAGSLYLFDVGGPRHVPDPASRFQPQDVHGSSEVIDPAAYRWRHPEWRGRPWEEAIIYELHVGAFSHEGTFAAVERRLDHIAALGATAVELLPIADFAGKRNWGYDGVFWFAPDSTYGRPEELKSLVDGAHERGLMIFLDVVYNHFGPEGNYLHTYAPQFFSAAGTPWGEALDFSQRRVRDFVIESVLLWLEEYQIDGLRFDAVDTMKDASDKHILVELAETVRAATRGRQVHLILENDDNCSDYLRRATDGSPLLYTAQWNDDAHRPLQRLVAQDTGGYYDDYAASPVAAVGQALAEGFSYQGQRSVSRKGRRRGQSTDGLPLTAFVNYLQSHDQVGNRALAERIRLLAADDAVRAAMGIVALAPSPPMLFMGEEWGGKSPFHFFCDFPRDLGVEVANGRRRGLEVFAHSASASVQRRMPLPNRPSTFARSKLDWRELTGAEQQEWLAFTSRLLALRRVEIVPRLAGVLTHSAQVSLFGGSGLVVTWPLNDGSRLELLANVGEEPLLSPRPIPAFPLIVIGTVEGQRLAGWTVVWSLTPAIGMRSPLLKTGRSDMAKPAPAASHLPTDNNAKAAVGRVSIETVWPEIDGGRFPIKRLIGESVTVEADLVVDGHDLLAGVLAYQQVGEADWHEVPLTALGNDRWRASFAVEKVGEARYTIIAWVNAFATWRHGLEKKVEAKQEVGIDLQIGAMLVTAAAGRATGVAAKRLMELAATMVNEDLPQAARAASALDPALSTLMAAHPDRSHASSLPHELKVRVDRARAGVGAWYEIFPRSTAKKGKKHGTLKDAAARLPYVAGMGFDVVYLPPIHPIGVKHRKGKNNSVTCTPQDPGSPWAIGSAAGGHKAVHPELGTLEDFRAFVATAKRLGLEVALDIAFQCAPDHPYVREHPEWFRARPDGSIQYAENPPKKYQDIYPFDFETGAWESLWQELKSIFEFWLEAGVKIFRVDNPHTKALAFWEWVIGQLRARDPEVIFLAEAFTRPKLMYGLAKRGFCQSYTYFTWRNSKWELTDYLRELTQGPVREYFRPSFWPNTPDILHASLQQGGRPAFMSRFVLAATLGANYGIYGPAFELCVNTPREPNSEEYIDSEKYEVKHWELTAPHSLRDLITSVNKARHDHVALQSNGSLHFHETENEKIICYSKRAGDDVMLMVVSLDPTWKQGGFVSLALDRLGLGGDEMFEVADLLTGARYAWRGARNYVELDPQKMPAHLFHVAHRSGDRS